MPAYTASAAQSKPKVETQIGRRLRALRKGRELSVTELAARANVSVGMISQIERSLSNPSVRTLERLRLALAVPLTALLEDGKARRDTQDERQLVRKGDERPFFHVGNQGVTKELLSPSGDHDLQMMIILLPAGASSADVLIGEGEKAGLVLSGAVVIDVAGQRAMLSEGDSFQFRSTLPHSVHNESSQEARILWVMNTKQPTTHL